MVAAKANVCQCPIGPLRFTAGGDDFQGWWNRTMVIGAPEENGHYRYRVLGMDGKGPICEGWSYQVGSLWWTLELPDRPRRPGDP